MTTMDVQTFVAWMPDTDIVNVTAKWYQPVWFHNVNDIFNIHQYEATNFLSAPRNLHGKWLARRPRTTIRLERNPTFRELLD